MKSYLRKRILPFLLLAALLFSGCGTGGGTKAPEDPVKPPEGSTAPQKEQSAEPVPAETPPQEDAFLPPVFASSHDEIFDAFHLLQTEEASAFSAELWDPGMFLSNREAASFGEPEFSNAMLRTEDTVRGNLCAMSGERILLLSGGDLICLEAAGAESRELGRIHLAGSFSDAGAGMETAEAVYPCGDRAFVVSYEYRGFSSEGENLPDRVHIRLVGLSDPAEPVLISDFTQTGRYLDSFAVNGRLFVLSSASVWFAEQEKAETYLPTLSVNGAETLLPAEDMLLSSELDSTDYTVLGAFSLSSGERLRTVALTGYYAWNAADPDRICLARSGSRLSVGAPYREAQYTVNDLQNSTRTWLVTFSADDSLSLLSTAAFPGSVFSDAALELSGGLLRLALFEYSHSGKQYLDESYGFRNYLDGEVTAAASVRVLDGELREIKSLRFDEERLYSIRFSGKYAYLIGEDTLAPGYFVDLTADALTPQPLSAEVPFPHTLFAINETRQLGFGASPDGGILISLYNADGVFTLLDRKPVELPFSASDFTAASVQIFPELQLAAVPARDAYLMLSLQGDALFCEGVPELGSVSPQSTVYFRDDCWYFCSEGCVSVFDRNYQNLKTIEFAFG